MGLGLGGAHFSVLVVVRAFVGFEFVHARVAFPAEFAWDVAVSGCSSEVQRAGVMLTEEGLACFSGAFCQCFWKR